jgi:hypothetical protein
MQTIKLKSTLPKTSFTPQWDITLGLFQYQNTDDLDAIRKFLISKESALLELESGDDAGTGVSQDSLTTRYGKYNLFDFADECPELDTLHDWIRTSFLEFIQHEAGELFDVEIVCWYNILRDGEIMKEHIHNGQDTSYLSGNIQMSSFDTQTHYRPPMDNVGTILQGRPGNMVLFPSYIPHSVDHEYQGERISIAFDLYPTHLMDEGNWGDYKKFMDQDIFKRLTSQ